MGAVLPVTSPSLVYDYVLLNVTRLTRTENDARQKLNQKTTEHRLAVFTHDI